MDKHIKIAAYVSVGPLGCLGYQYISDLVLEQNARVFDHVYVVSTSPSTRELPFIANNISLISDESSWNVQYDDNGEYFDIAKRRQPTWIFDLSRSEGYDFLINISINQYLDDENAIELRKYAQEIKAAGNAFGYVWKAYQVRSYLYLPDRRLPWLVNLHAHHNISFAPDSLLVDGKKYSIESGLYIRPPYFLIDVDGLLTEKDSFTRWHYYTKHLNRYFNGEEGDWDYREECLYRINKIRFKCMHRKIKTEISNKIASRYPDACQAVIFEKVTRNIIFKLSNLFRCSYMSLGKKFNYSLRLSKK